MLSDSQLETYRAAGHVTVPDILSSAQVTAAAGELEDWTVEFLSTLSDDRRQWFLESGGAASAVRKLDHPVVHRELFKEIATSSAIVEIVEQLIGRHVSVLFSQVFCKPPEVGGPKPVHQDNFYFGPDNLDSMVTVWIAIDAATEENGCLFFADGSNHGPVYEHFAPEGEPFNLQIETEYLDAYEMTAAPVSAGGVSFHHGNTWHQSSANRSQQARRAVVFHFIQNDAELKNPALNYDQNMILKVT